MEPLCSMNYLIAMLCFAFSIQLTDSLRFTSVQIPSLVQRQANFWLICQFQLGESSSSDTRVSTSRFKVSSTDDQLYSVKWYRNNEEFYRLLVGPQLAASSLDNSSGQQQQQQQLQQQYFPQAGVNVMMSSSNATHVRLLNASLDTEGLYACEISTQNLSTIRYEREIRVYVLPHSRPTIIGLRSRYSLGDKVDLICTSDYSRPQPALGWFINGERIDTSPDERTSETGSPNSWFELNSSRRLKANEPTLSKLSLALKFRLTSELLAWFAPVASSPPVPLSQLPSQKQQLSDSNGTESLQFPSKSLKLQCKYKLTELSDVAFNELPVQQTAEFSSNTQLPLVMATQNRPQFADSKRRRRRRRRCSRCKRSSRRKYSDDGRRMIVSWRLIGQQSTPISSSAVRVSKSSGSQLSQSRAPAPARDLLKALGLSQSLSASRANQESACSSGALAIGPDDPLLVGVGSDEYEESSSVENEEEDEEEEEATRSEPKAEWRTITVNCSTASALALVHEHQSQPRNPIRLLHVEDEPLTRSRVASPDLRPLSVVGASSSTKQTVAYCADPNARRRSLISGRVVLDSPSSAGQKSSSLSTGSSLSASRSTVQVAYLSLQPAGSNKSREQSVAHELLPYSPGSGTTSHHDSADSSDSLHHHPSTFSYQQQQHFSLPPPPLLEWFINNQEAPKSSASYQPKLPLSDSISTPSVDYTEYFANFENRPVQQHLLLRLKLERRHFMTADSILRLRCSSTQAQLLMTDSVSAIIIPANQQIPLSPGSSGWLPQTRSRNLLQNNRAQRPNSSSCSAFFIRRMQFNAIQVLMTVIIQMFIPCNTHQLN